MLLLVMGCLASLKGQANALGYQVEYYEGIENNGFNFPVYEECSELPIGIKFSGPSNNNTQGGDFEICLTIPTNNAIEGFFSVNNLGDFETLTPDLATAEVCVTVNVPPDMDPFDQPIVTSDVYMMYVVPRRNSGPPILRRSDIIVSIEELNTPGSFDSYSPTGTFGFDGDPGYQILLGADISTLYGDGGNDFAFPKDSKTQAREILLNGILHIDEDYTFGGCGANGEGSFLTLKKESEIIVDPGVTFTIEGSSIAGCANMWSWIIVRSGATLNIKSAQNCAGNTVRPNIRDAISAVIVEDGGNLFVENADFVNNRMGIFVDESFSGDIDQQLGIEVRGTTFEQQEIPGTERLRSLKPPFANQSITAGAVINDVQSSVLFNVSESGGFNHFRNMNNGIIVHRSFASVKASIFESMIDEDTEMTGNGIVVDDTNGNLPSFNPTQVVIGANNPSQQVVFDNMHTAIRLKNNSNVFINKCNIDNVDFGVKGDFVGYISMTGNNVTSNMAGVDIEARFPDVNQRIIDNVFTARNGTSETEEMPTFGIRLMDVDIGDGNYDQMAIRNNDFILDGASEGVYAVNSKGVRIENQNTFTWAEETFFSDAIHFEGGERGLVFNNTIDGPNSTGFADSRGVYVSGMPIARVACNTIDLVDRNVHMVGVNPGTLMAGNHFEGGGIGLKLGIDGLGALDISAIGAQTHRANSWTNPEFLFGAEHENPDFQAQSQSIFFVSTNSDDDYLPTLPPENEDWFEDEPLPSVPEFVCPSGPPAQYPGDKTDDSFVTEVIAQTYPTNDPWLSTYWTANYEVYKMYRSGWIDSTAHANFSNWIMDINNSDVPYYYTVEKGMTELFRLDSIDQANYDLSVQRIRDFSDSLSSAQEALYYATTAADSLILLSQLDSLTRELETEYDYAFFAGLDSTVAARVPGLEALNNALTTDSLFKTNRQSVNTHTFTYLTTGKLGLSQNAIQDLKAIADQCPYDGGQAVYAARSLVNIVDGPSYFNDSLSCAPVSENLPTKDPKTGNATVYPNPTSGLTSLRLEEGYITAVRLIDGFGRVLMKKSWSNGGSLKRDLDFSGFPSGIYTLEITSDETVISTERLILQ